MRNGFWQHCIMIKYRREFVVFDTQFFVVRKNKHGLMLYYCIRIFKCYKLSFLIVSWS